MKKTRKLVSLVCAVVMVLAMVAPAGAAVTSTTEDVIGRSEIILTECEDYVLSLVGEDLENGNVRFSMVENEKIISVYYVDHANKETIYTEYEDGVASYSETAVFEMKDQIISQQRTASSAISPRSTLKPNYINVGKVGYYHYMQGMIGQTNYIDWAYKTSISDSTIDINGQYRDFAAVCSRICELAQFITAAGGMKIATLVMNRLGWALDKISIAIPEYLLDCERTEIAWRASVGSSEKIISGSRCVITHQSKEGQVYYEGDYFPTTAIASHNVELAVMPYTYFYKGGDGCEIASWPI